MLLHVIHETAYDYAPAVRTAQHMAHLKPAHGPRQRLLEHQLTITPEPAQRSESVDVYGNTRSFFSLQSAHEQLRVRAESLVATVGTHSHTLVIPPEERQQLLEKMLTYLRSRPETAEGEFEVPLITYVKRLIRA